MTTAIAGDREATRLVEEQAALRRVATLVARESAPVEVFAAVTEEAARVLGIEAVAMLRFERDETATLVARSRTQEDLPPPGTGFTLEGENVITSVHRTGQAARRDDWGSSTGSIAAMARSLGMRSTVATPIVVERRVWGTLVAVTRQPAPLPADTEARIGQFTELIATAISTAEARGELSKLMEEQAALRRVATLVARGAPPADVFDAVAGELGRLLGVGSTGLVRFEDDDTATVVAGWGRLGEAVAVGARLRVGGSNVVSQIARTGKPARMDDFAGAASGTIAERARRVDTRVSVGGPIVVAGRLWGAMVAAALEGEVMPPDTEARLEQFTELIATTIASTEARVEVARLADGQTALRRVATLVAEEAPAAELFATVADEVAGVLGARTDSAIVRYEADGTATVMAVCGERLARGIPIRTRLAVDGDDVTAGVLRERCPIRVDDYGAEDRATARLAHDHGIRSAVGCPVLVGGRVWGALVAARHDGEPFAADTERRISQFSDLVATAIANADARAELRRLADEQAALRRVATLVAEGAAPARVFDAAIVEVAHLLGAAQVGLMRQESPHEASILANRGQDPAVIRAGMRVPLDGESATARVLRTGRSARVNLSDQHRGAIAAIARHNDVNGTVGAPIMVEGIPWGAITASWQGEEMPPADAEERLAEFAQLLGTAIANADSRDQLTASRARAISAGDEARRRVVRDLHDGAQQRQVHTIVTLKMALRALRDDRVRAESLVAEALDHAQQGNAELRELAHGILPSVLTRGGLRAGVDALVSRLEVPVQVAVTGRRLPPAMEESAYFIVAEALTNLVKHAQATRAEVTAAVDDATLRLEVRDDGVGGADPQGHGLLGVADRVAALGGRLRIDSPRGGGTVVTAELPVPA